MKFKEFKKRYEILTRNDTKAPSDDEYKILIDEAIKQIARDTTPLELVEIDHRNFEVDYYIDDEYFIRKANHIIDDESMVDFSDEMLLISLLNAVAFRRSTDTNRQVMYENNYKKALCNYEINNFDERSFNLTQALKVKGWAKPYTINYALDPYYSWDSEFLSKLDFYLANIAMAKNLSYRKFIYLFIDFQNNLIDPNREDMRELDRLMSKRIKGV